MLNHIVSAITKRTSVQFQLNEYGRYLRRVSINIHKHVNNDKIVDRNQSFIL